MNKYIIEFSKIGLSKYISHLDLMRLFKRAFKKSGISLSYSHGFNPHPKMSFAQPLALGYTSKCELLEFETEDQFKPWFIKDAISQGMTQGITISNCYEVENQDKSLAALAAHAEYLVKIPIAKPVNISHLIDDFMGQKSIVAYKKKKKLHERVQVEIKDKIRSFKGSKGNSEINLHMDLDCGSISNLSPELVIESFLSFSGITAEREEIQVERESLYFGE